VPEGDFYHEAARNSLDLHFPQHGYTQCKTKESLTYRRPRSWKNAAGRRVVFKGNAKIFNTRNTAANSSVRDFGRMIARPTLYLTKMSGFCCCIDHASCHGEAQGFIAQEAYCTAPQDNSLLAEADAKMVDELQVCKRIAGPSWRHGEDNDALSAVLITSSMSGTPTCVLPVASS